VKGWTSLFGRQVHASGVGGLKARLRNSLATPVPVDRYEPTTKECFACGRPHELSLGDRILQCECGWTCDRDHNAALVILRKGLGLSPDQAVGLDRPEPKPLEREAVTRILGSNPYIREEAPLFRGGRRSRQPLNDEIDGDCRKPLPRPSSAYSASRFRRQPPGKRWVPARWRASARNASREALALAVASPSSPERNRSKATRTYWASETPSFRARSFKSRSWSSLK